MERVNYTKLNLKTNNNTKSVKVGDSEILVYQYITAQDKMDLINITLQKSKVGEVYNPFLIDMYFHLNLVYLCTNITFTAKQREDEFKLYDQLESNGVIDAVIGAVDYQEYQDLQNYIVVMQNDTIKADNSVAAVARALINDLPKNAEAAAKIVDTFDQDKYKEVINFAKSAGILNYKA
jgi:hypothetical protein